MDLNSHQKDIFFTGRQAIGIQAFSVMTELLQIDFDFLKIDLLIWVCAELIRRTTRQSNSLPRTFIFLLETRQTQFMIRDIPIIALEIMKTTIALRLNFD